jgi:hypothetical protein
MRPGVLAGQRIPSDVAAVTSQTLAKSKSDLLADIDVTLKTLRSLRPQMRSAPADVRSSFDRVFSVDETFKQAVQRAATKRQITLASRTLGSVTAKAMPFTAYLRFRCEGSATGP